MDQFFFHLHFRQEAPIWPHINSAVAILVSNLGPCVQKFITFFKGLFISARSVYFKGNLHSSSGDEDVYKHARFYIIYIDSVVNISNWKRWLTFEQLVPRLVFYGSMEGDATMTNYRLWHVVSWKNFKNFPMVSLNYVHINRDKSQ